MIKQLTAAALGLAAILGSTPARADYLVYTNRAAFESAITGESTERFDELGGNIQIFGTNGLSPSVGLDQPISISGSNNFLLSASAPLGNIDKSYGTYLLGPISNSATDGIKVNLPINAYGAAGADVAAFASNSVVSFVVTTSDGSSFNSRVAVDTSSPGLALGFLGVVLTTPGDYVTSLTFSTPIGSAQNVLIDNLSFGLAPSTVPEPASMALMAVGSLVLATVAARRRLLKRPT